MKVVDFYSGLGGWSDGFAKEGFQVLGVEINEEIAQEYRYPVLVADVRGLNAKMFKDFDVIVGSPPCRDFSVTTSFGWKYWKRKPDVIDGLSMVFAFLHIIKEAQPKFWIMENVPRLEKVLHMKPVCVVQMSTYMKRGLWGEFPDCLIPMKVAEKALQDVKGKHRAWKRAKIPFCVSNTIAKAIKDKLVVGGG